MSLSGLILGLINIAIVIAILLLIGAIVLWFMSWMGMAVPAMVQKLYIGIVALIGLYMLVALLLGMPSVRFLGFRGVADTVVAGLSSTATADL